MADLDRLLRPDISMAAQDAAQAPDFTLIERRGARLRRSRTGIAVAVAAIALLAVLGSRQLIVARPAVPGSAPSSVTVSIIARPMPSADARIDPGTYRIPRSTRSAVDFTVSFPSGWRSRMATSSTGMPARRLTLNYKPSSSATSTRMRAPVQPEPSSRSAPLARTSLPPCWRSQARTQRDRSPRRSAASRRPG